jgi:ketosteroid isomerase-like protein
MNFQDNSERDGLDRAHVLSRLHAYLERLEARDLVGLMDFFADDIAFELIGNWSIFPQVGRSRGKDAWARALATIYTNLEYLDSTVHDVVIDGDWVALRRTARLRSYGTGKIDEVIMADFIRVRDGLIVEVTEIIDSLAIDHLESG